MHVLLKTKVHSYWLAADGPWWWNSCGFVFKLRLQTQITVYKFNYILHFS